MASVQELSQIEHVLATSGYECVLATLVSVNGSSYRRPGARMLIGPNRTVAGGITAGCLEEDIRQSAFEWTRAGPCVRDFQIGSAEDDLLGWGSGCKGTLRVLLQRVAPMDSMLAKLTRALERRQTCISATVFDSDPRLNLPMGTRFLLLEDTVLADADAAWLQDMLISEARHLPPDTAPCSIHYSTARGTFALFWEIVRPAIQLCVFGSGEGVAPLLGCARNLGWKTILCNQRTEMYNRQCGLHADRIFEAFPGEFPAEVSGDDRAAAVVMTHRFNDDLAIVSSLLLSDIPFVGVLGGRIRNQKLRSELLETVAPRHFKKLFAPVGLDLGAADSTEIALAIAGEVLAFMNGRVPGHLADRQESIHAPFQNEHRNARTNVSPEPAACLSAP